MSGPVPNGDRPSVGARVAPVLRAIGRAVVRGAEALRREAVAFDAPARIARTAEEIRALEIDRRAAALARRGGAGARKAAGLAQVQAARAARVGGPALRQAWNRSAARVTALGTRTPRPAAPPAEPSTAIPPDPRRRQTAAMKPLPLFEADGAAPPIAPPAIAAPPDIAAPASTTRRIEGKGAQATIGIGGIGIGALAAALYAAQPAAPPAAPESAAFGEAVRAYILEHPEIIPEAVARLQQRDTGRLIADNRAALQTPFSGAWAGAADGDVVLVEFTDYACGFCRASVADVDRLVAGDRRLKVVYRELPILGPGSDEAAQVALSAARQGHHAAVHRALFAAGSPDAAKAARVALATGLDPAKVQRDRVDPSIRAEIERNAELARAIGLTGTPTFIVGDRVLSGAFGYDALREAIAAARAGAPIGG